MTVKSVLTEAEVTHLVEICFINGLSRNQCWSLVRLLQHWERHHGISWVVNRLKMYIADLLGNPQLVRKNSLGEWFGHFRPIYQKAHTSTAGFRNMLRILKLYGRWTKPDVTEEDISKFVDTISVENTYYESPQFRGFRRYLPDTLRVLARKIVKAGVDFDRTLPLNRGTSPIYGGKVVQRRHITPYEHVEATYDFPNLMVDHCDFFNDTVGIRVLDRSDYITATRVHPYDKVGTVRGLRKDRGWKVRFIANPYYLLQTGLSRLKRASELLLQQLPESAVYDQESGVQWVHERLLEGCEIQSLDLTSCSDLLPADPQFDLLVSLFPSLEEDINLFRMVSRSYWYCYGREVQWRKGQPLGTFPSFSSFTIYHILLARSVGGNSSNFRVIGDDIVISSPQVAKAMISTYRDLGVPISWSKTLRSRDYAEFAGRLITKAGKLQVYKAAPLNLSKDPIGYIRQYGRKGLKLLPMGKVRSMAKVGLLPPPVGYGSLKLHFMAAEDVLALYSNYLSEVSIDPVPASSYKHSFDHLPVSQRDRIDFAMNQEDWLDNDYLKTKEVGIGFEVRSNDRLLADHVNSWTSSIIEEVPAHVRELHDQLVTSQTPIGFEDQDVKPVSFLRRVWKRISRYFT